jgi:trehalose 6-phosphate phosphatase
VTLQRSELQVQIPGLTYGGNHGFQIEFASGIEYVHQVPPEIRANFPKMVAALEAQVVHDGSWVENKHASLTFHYRSMPQELRPPVLAKASEIISQFGYRCSQAHEALEAKPPVDWNKGFAAAYVLDHEFGTNWKNEIKTIFAGDDTTDEDIMRVIKGGGRSYRVTRGCEVVTEADFRIHDTGDVFLLLQWLKRLFLE